MRKQKAFRFPAMRQTLALFPQTTLFRLRTTVHSRGCERPETAHCTAGANAVESGPSGACAGFCAAGGDASYRRTCVLRMAHVACLAHIQIYLGIHATSVLHIYNVPRNSCHQCLGYI